MNIHIDRYINTLTRLCIVESFYQQTHAYMCMYDIDMCTAMYMHTGFSALLLATEIARLRTPPSKSIQGLP